MWDLSGLGPLYLSHKNNAGREGRQQPVGWFTIFIHTEIPVYLLQVKKDRKEGPLGAKSHSTGVH